jgi:hypothetical protein
VLVAPGVGIVDDARSLGVGFGLVALDDPFQRALRAPSWFGCASSGMPDRVLWEF